MFSYILDIIQLKTISINRTMYHGLDPSISIRRDLHKISIIDDTDHQVLEVPSSIMKKSYGKY